MADHRDPEPALDVAGGDDALSRQLRRSLALLRDRTDNEDFRRQLDEVLAGRMSLREAAATGTFDRGLTPHFERGMQRFQEMSEAERERLARDGQAALDGLAAEPAEQRPTAEQRSAGHPSAGEQGPAGHPRAGEQGPAGEPRAGEQRPAGEQGPAGEPRAGEQGPAGEPAPAQPLPERPAGRPPTPPTGLPTVHDGWEEAGGPPR